MAIHNNSVTAHRDRPHTARSLAGFADRWYPNLTHLAWLQSVIATAGSLYFSEAMKLTPCVLCWYQRIAMYPLVVILTVGITLRDARLRSYALPLSLIGLAIAIYHNLLYYGVIPENIQPCTTGISCTTRQIEWLGFITIPLLALVAFSVISVSLLLHVPATEDDSPGEFTSARSE
jgi:disulfide bond formation protein DsbB